MGIARPHPPVLLLCGLISRFDDIFDEAETRLAAAFGPVALRSELMDFTATDYYREEMGKPLKRRFLVFDHPFDPGALAAAKHATDRMEADLAAAGRWPAKRPVNLDPGYLTPAKLVLATTKDFSHRMYIGDGMFAEITLRYQDGRWQAWPWTFPDYRAETYHPFLTRARERLLPNRANQSR